MRKLIVSLAAAVSAFAVAAPASAQYYGGGYPAYGYNDYGRSRSGYNDYRGGYESRQLIAANRERMARMHRDIEMAAARGRISPGEASNLHRRAAQFDRELAQLARGGMTGEEGAMFDARADRLAQEIQARTYGYGYGYDRYNRW